MPHLIFKRNRISLVALSCGLTLTAGLVGCDNTSDLGPANYYMATTKSLQTNVKNIVVIYAENRAFDNLYGDFPGANGLSTVVDASGKPTAAYIPQKDRDGSVLPYLPRTWTGATQAGQTPVVSEAKTGTASSGLPNAPFAIETAFANYNADPTLTLTSANVTRDLYHRFFENQMEIDGGKNDMFAAWADAGGLTMGHFSASKSALYQLAQQNVLADNFFEGAYGGSFLNHQYLICACAPQYPNADTAAAKPTITSVLTKSGTASTTKNVFGDYTYTLAPKPNTATDGTNNGSPASALSGPPKYVLSGNIAPHDYFGNGDGYRAINTMQPAYQPSGNTPADTTGNDSLYATTTAATTLPPQTQQNIGDQLTAKNISWKWYGGAWTAALADGVQDPKNARTVIYKTDSNGVANTSGTAPDFQPHHQPFNYYANLDPVTHAADRAAHLQDYNDLVKDAAAGTLPPVAFYKPEGAYNQHEGYANVDTGDQKIADLVAKLQASPQYANMVIVITYDEFGGVYDHVAPPKGDLLGPGTRIPALIISPMAKKGTVDHTQYDTASILRLITRRFDLTPLAGLTARDAALKANGAQPMGDLTNALNL